MSAHFKWYPASEEVVVPWNARYSFPSQANKAVKITPRIPPKNGATFLPGQIIRVEFPAQGYVNPINTTFEFDVTLQPYATPANEITRFQNNIQSIFNRVRLLYGATPLEDIINYNMVVRALTEWTSTNQVGTMDQTSISEGIGGVCFGADGSATTASVQGLVNVRQAYIQGCDNSTMTTALGLTNGIGPGLVPNNIIGTGLTTQGTNRNCTRRYQVNLALGLLTQDKLLPVKFMASQLAIELTLEQPNACIFTQPGGASDATPTYGVTNFNMIPEILEFDASYDAMFLKGLQDGGVPIKFSSWHTFIFSTAAASNVNLQVQERSRSVKALFAMQRRQPYLMTTDSGATFFDTFNSSAAANTGSTMSNYQWRIGGRYFPSQPVQNSITLGGSVTNGGCEAFVELQKALNVVGDYRLSTSANVLRWGLPAASASITPSSGTATNHNELDYVCNQSRYSSLTASNGVPTYAYVSKAAANATGNTFCGNVGSACYASAIDLETSNGVEISGLNAEEQSDIAFIANWSGAQASNFNIEVYSYYDAMIILRENNVLELIQ